MPLIIDLPDGNSVEIPDDASPELRDSVRQKIREKYGDQPKPAGIIESSVRDVASGFGQTAAMAPRALQIMAGTFGAADKDLPPEESGTVLNPKTNALARTLGETADSVDQYWKEVGEKSTNNSWVSKLLRGAGGAVAGGGVTPTAIAAGGGSGIGAEVAERMAPGNPLAALGGSVIGGTAAGGLTALASRARPQTANLAREAMEGIPEEQLLTAQKFQAAAKAQGHDIDLSQALVATSETGGGNLTSIRNALAGRKQGNQVQEVLRNQPGAITQEAELAVAGMPGKNISPTTNANRVQATATEVLEKAKADRGKLWESTLAKGVEEQKKLGAKGVSDAVAAAQKTAQDLVTVHPKVTGLLQNLEKARAVAAQAGLPTDKLDMQAESARKILTDIEKVHQDAVGKIASAKASAAATTKIPAGVLKAAEDHLDKVIASHPPASAEAKELAGLRAALQGRDGPLTDPSQINQIFKQFTTRLKSPDLKTAGVDAGVNKYLGKVVGDLRERLGAGFTPLRQANTAYKNFTESVINPLKQGPVGTLAQPRGYMPETQAMVSKFEGLLNKGTDPTAKVSDIATAAKGLAKVDPGAFENAFKGWLSGKVQKALNTGTNELPLAADGQSAQRLYTALFGDKLQWQGIKDATKQMAIIRGEKPEEVIRGLENLHSLVKAMKSTPASVSGLSPEDLKRIGGGSATANLVRVASFLPMNKAGEAIERSVLGKTLIEFDDILTSPEGVSKLIKLGKVPVMSRQAQVILGTFGGTAANIEGLPVPNPR